MRGSSVSALVVAVVALVVSVSGASAPPPTTPATVSSTASTTAPVGGPTLARGSYAASTSTQAMDVWTPPATAGAGPFPAVVLVHGGGFVAGDRREWATVGPALARRGYVAVAIDYSLRGTRFPTEVDDVAAAVTALRRRAADLQVDSTRIALWGSSAGANLAAMAATARGAPVAAVVGWAGPYDLATANTGLYRRDVLDKRSAYLGCDVRTAPCRATRAVPASPTSFVTAATPPMLLVASSADRRQPQEQLERMRRALQAAGRPVTTFVFPGTEHTDSPGYAVAATGPSIAYLDGLLKRASAPAPAGPSALTASSATDPWKRRAPAAM